MSRDRLIYRWDQIVYAAPVCGIAMGALTYWQTHAVIGSLVTGLLSVVGIAGIWWYRIRYQRRERSQNGGRSQ